MIRAAQLVHPIWLCCPHASLRQAAPYGLTREGKILSAELLTLNSTRPVFLHHLYRSSRLEFENLA